MIDKKKKSNISGWLAGIMGTVVGGIVVWWLTTNPASPFVQRSVDIKLLDLPPYLMLFVNGHNPPVVVNVYNEGDATAENCSILWFMHQDDHPDEDDHLLNLVQGFGVAAKGTRAFTINPIMTKEIADARGWTGESVVSFKATMRLQCKGVEPKLYLSNVSLYPQ